MSTERGGTATAAGERETLPATGGRTHGEKKGDTCSHKHIQLFSLSLTVLVKFLFFYPPASGRDHEENKTFRRSREGNC